MEGHQLGGRYQLLSRIGGGGMAIVYKAKDLVLNRQVAVKLLRPQFGTDEDFVQRFRREAQSVASLSHPNIVSVYDVGQEDDTYYMVMEYIEGSTLKDVINAQGALPAAEAVRIATKICDALEHAHQNHIIHRDIKPHNILISKNGWVKVTDFGIARAVTSATITHTGSVLGSVHYFSPEQARGGITGEKSDIYSLGIVLYEMVTGELPFSGDSPISIALMHLQNPLPEPRKINPDLPQSLENVILKALAKDPFLRYGSAREMLEDLQTCLSPERQNEGKIMFPVDENETRVFHAITPEMLEQGKQERAALSRGNSQKGEEGKPTNKKWLKKTAMWAGAIAIFCIIAVVGLIYSLDVLYVPEVKVPHVEGTHIKVAEVKLKDANLTPVIVEQYSDKDVGMVFRQDPAPPISVKENSSVTLYVSKGKQQIKMPNLMSLSQKTAEELLDSEKFIKPKIEKKEDDSAPLGQVIEQYPPPDTLVIPSDTEVRIIVSEGKKETKMPVIIGLDINSAIVKLLNAGLVKGEVREEPSYEIQEPNIVLSTHPYDAGMPVEVGTEIPLTVSNGKLPQDAKVAAVPIIVQLNEGVEQQAEVKIVVKDSRNKEVVAVQETIVENRQFDVELVLAPDKNGTIQVFKNGELEQNHVIEYRTLP